MSKENTLFHQVQENITFDTLWSQALESLTALSGDNWTDTGDHDPGITLLQAITWNCTDLSYRTTLSLNDLLTAKEQKTLFPAEFGPHNVLTCNTVTAEDYRRALRDLHSSDTALTGEHHDFLFRDAYLVREPEESRFHWWYNAEKREYQFTEPTQVAEENKEKLTLRGNYWLYILPTRFTQSLSATDRGIVEAYLNEFLLNHRNLGEAFSHVLWLQPARFSPQFTIELAEDIADINKVVAEIYQILENLILPAATHQTTDQMQGAGYSYEEIFMGPFLPHGWQQEASPLISAQGITLNLSQLFNRLLEIAGIATISEFKVDAEPSRITAVEGDCWSWQVADGYYPQLWGQDPLTLLTSSNSPLRLIIKGGIYSVPDREKIAAYLTAPTLIQMKPVLLPAGERRNLARYTPTGSRLPGCYQLQQPDESIDNPVRELHQFLLPADQWLADGCAQLAILPQLLAFTGRGEGENSNLIRGTCWPYQPDSVQQQVHQRYADQLQHFQQQDASIFLPQRASIHPANFSRELDFINYLLGYFGTNRAARPLTLDVVDFLTTQRAYLAQQPSLGYDRINIRIDQVSALQKRIAARIGLNKECFAPHADLGKLPFYLIEHRQLMPQMPDSQFNTVRLPDDFIVQAPQVTLTQTGTAGKLFRGQLIELIASEGESELHVGPLLITATQGNSFILSTENSQQLERDLERLQTAWTNKQLRWKNSDIWLQDMDYRLHYAEEPPTGSNQCRLSSNDQTPYPAMMAVGDTITLRKGSLGEQTRARKATAEAGEWQIEATIKALDVVAGTILIEKAAGQEPFPAADQAWKYLWNFTDAAYATTDRFSFSISIVINRSLITGSNIDPARLIEWLQQTILPEFPAHVSLIHHWLSDSEFKNFAATYKRWQNSGTPLGDDAFSIMQMLTLGRLPVQQLGIGLMRIATEAQKEQVVGSSGTEWNTAIILSEELLYIPQEL